MKEPPNQRKTNRRLRVFLCHSSGDKKIVRDLHRRLEADGFAPWIDERDLLPGDEWERAIPDAVQACDVVVICLSKNSVTKDGYVQKEIGIALDVEDKKPEGTNFIIPVRIDEVEVPKRLSKWYWADLFHADGYGRLSHALKLRACSIGIPDMQVLVPIAAEQRDFLGLRKTSWHRAVFLTLLLFASGTMIIIVKDRMRKQPQNSTSVSPLEKKASMGEVDAMIQLADQYDHIGEPQKAFLWYEKGAIAGDPGAMYMICRMYEAGRGVAQDHQLGAIWCQKARARTGIRGSW